MCIETFMKRKKNRKNTGFPAESFVMLIPVYLRNRDLKKMLKIWRAAGLQKALSWWFFSRRGCQGFVGWLEAYETTAAILRKAKYRFVGIWVF